MNHRSNGASMIRPGWLAVVGLAVLALLVEGIPLASLLYVGVLLLCPLLMAGMHRGHGSAYQHGADAAEARSSDRHRSEITSAPPHEEHPHRRDTR